MNEADLIDKLAKIERLYAGATTLGEKDAAAQAMHRIRKRLSELCRQEKLLEFKFTLRDRWSQQLFIALVRRYELRPFRYPRQRQTTVMVRAPASFVNQTLWPEYQELDKVLRGYLNEVTQRVISEAINSDTDDVPEEAGTDDSSGRHLDCPD